MSRKLAFVAVSMLGAAVLLPGKGRATDPVIFGTEFTPIINVNPDNYLSMLNRNKAGTIKTELEKRTGKNGPPVMNGVQSSYLNSDGLPGAASATSQSGLSAGDGWPTISLWTSGSYTHFSDDHPTVQVDSDTYSASVGADVQPFDFLIAGLSFSYDDTHSDSDLPLAGGGTNNANDDTNSYTVAPYAVYIINDMFDVDASFGYTWSDTDSERFNGTAVVTSSTDSDAWFFAVNGNATHWFDYVGVTGSLGYRRSSSTMDGFTESDGTIVNSSETTLGTVVGSARVSYYYPTGLDILQSVLPFFSVTAEWDHTKDQADIGVGQVAPTDDRFGLVIRGGVNVGIMEGVSAGVEASGIALRTDQSSTTVSGNVSISF